MQLKVAQTLLLISETGTLILNNARLRCHRAFTLWEMLIVVIIISVSTSVILLSTSLGRDSNDLKVLGSDMSKLIQLLYQEAIFENRNFAISLKHDGYQVLEYDGQSWIDSDQTMFRRIKLNEVQSSTLVVEELAVKSVDQEELIPHILILASGEMTPFEWTIIDDTTKNIIVLEGNLLGKIRMEGPTPQPL
jgi:prepilin-type N-terminal cleavage/methylation domain-containing protein